MRIESTPEVRSYVRERGGLLFVRAKRFGSALCGVTLLEATTEPPPDALDWRRIETHGFLVFVPRAMRLPKALELRVRGRIRRRIDALWDGCAYVI
ncbi:MAG: hypothetical protein WBM72_10585 [Actinomycetota bacterium]